MCALRTYAFVQFWCCFGLGSQAKSWGMTGIFASGVFELLKWAGKFDWSNPWSAILDHQNGLHC